MCTLTDHRSDRILGEMLESRRDGSFQSLYTNNAGRSWRRACGKRGGELRERGPVLPETEKPEKAGWPAAPKTTTDREDGYLQRGC